MHTSRDARQDDLEGYDLAVMACLAINDATLRNAPCTEGQADGFCADKVSTPGREKRAMAIVMT